MNLPRVVARAAGNAATAVTEAAGAVTGAVVGGVFGAIKGAVTGVGLGNPHRHNTGHDDRASAPPTTPARKDTRPERHPRAASPRPGPAAPRGKPTTIDRNDTASIRAWARSHGHPVSARGPIPAAVRDAYNAAH